MVRFQHTVTLAAVPRRWFESCVVMLHDLAEGIEADGARLRLPDGRPLPGLLLAEGRHLRKGARYHPVNDEDGEPDTDGTVTVLAWDRRRETALEVVMLDKTSDNNQDNVPGRMACTLRLASAERPRKAMLSGMFRVSGGSWTKYTRGSGRLHLDLDMWWSATAGRRGRAATPVTGAFDHPLTRATVKVRPRPAPDGHWRVTVEVRVKGRSFARLLLPVAMAVMGQRTRGAFARSLDDAAKEWNDQVPGLVRQNMEQLRLDLAESLFDAEGDREAEEGGGSRQSLRK